MKKFLLLPLLALILAGCGIITRGGEQIGYITATEQNGLIFKPKFVYLKSELESSQEEVWCIEDNDVLSKIKEAKDNKQRVKIFYHDELFYWFSRCDGMGNGMIDGVEVLE